METNNNLANTLESLKRLLEDSKNIHLSKIFKNSYILERDGDKLIITCKYLFHKEILNKHENKLIIEEYLSQILETKVYVEFIEFGKAINSGYEIALKEEARMKELAQKESEKYEKELEETKKEESRKRIVEAIKNRIPLKFRNAELKNSLRVVQDYYSQEKYKEKGLFLYGNYGTGKTYNVYALAKSLIENNIDVWTFNLPRLLNIIRASFSKQGVYNEESGNTSYAFIRDMSGIEKLIEKDILIIDDIGAEKASDWVAETLYYLINSRYENMKTTIFTSNLNLNELSDKVGDRIVSRIAEMCDIYEVEGEDKRLK